MPQHAYFAGLRVCQYDLVYRSGHMDEYWDGLKTVSMMGGGGTTINVNMPAGSDGQDVPQ